MTVYEGDRAVEEVREEHPVHDGRPHNGEDGEDGGGVLSPGPQQQATQVIKLGYLMRLT